MKRFLTALFMLLTFAVCAQAQASGEVEFSQGIALYKKGKYSAALTKFEAARRSGMEEPRLDFNLALCNLKLHRYDQARDLFLLAAKHKPLKGLVNFNIGLLELERGDRDEAEKWFIQVRDNAAEAKLRALAAQRLALLEQPSPYDAEQTIWDSGYRLHAGYDDNIEDPALAGTTDKGDSFTSALMYATRARGGANGLRIGVVGFLQHYNAVHVYDLDLLQLSVDKGLGSGDWQNRLGAELESTTLGGNNYLQTTKLYVSGKRSLSTVDELRLRYRHSAISAKSQSYDYLAGNRHELEVRWLHRRQNLSLQAGYELELNDRNDYRGTTVFSSYSPTRHTIDLHADAVLASDWKMNGRLSWRASQYNDANILADSSKVKRADERTMLAFGLSRKLSKGLAMEFEYRFTENHSNIASYHYTRNIYTLGISGTF